VPLWRWNAFIPEGEANAAIGYEEFVTKLLPRFGGPDAQEQWKRLMKNIVLTPEHHTESYLVGCLEHVFFFHILGIITPTDEVHHFSEG
jgi:hypothetical protein